MLNQAIGRIKTASKTLIRSELDGLDLLRSDHMKAEALLVQLRVIHDERRRAKLFRSLRADLAKHMSLEETLFYPACARVSELAPLVENSFDEHNEARKILDQMSKVAFTSKRFSTLTTELIKNISRHVSIEENKLFPEVRDKMKEQDFNRLSREMIRVHHQGERARSKMGKRKAA